MFYGQVFHFKILMDNKLHDDSELRQRNCAASGNIRDCIVHGHFSCAIYRPQTCADKNCQKIKFIVRVDKLMCNVAMVHFVADVIFPLRHCARCIIDKVYEQWPNSIKRKGTEFWDEVSF